MTTPAPDHILIVDDDAGIRELAAEYLQRQGLQVRVAADGRQMRELLARIHAVLRRTRMLPPNLAKAEPARHLMFGDWRLDTTARHLLDATGAVVALSGAEYRLLRVLLDHPQRILTRDQLLQLTQGRDADVFDRSIDLLVSRVRQRLGDGARGSRYIKTVRNEGYVFCADVQTAAAAAGAAQ